MSTAVARKVHAGAGIEPGRQDIYWESQRESGEMSGMIPLYKTVAICEPEAIPRMCRWFGHKFVMDFKKTHPYIVRVHEVNHYCECRRCHARKVLSTIFDKYEPFDRDWVAQGANGGNRSGL